MSDDARPLLRRFVLALAVWREARGESNRGKRLVAQVIRNRVDDRRWPDTYVGVITQPWQFSAFNRNDPNATLFPKETDAAWADCVAAADAILTAAQPISDANHYHTVDVSPAWKHPDREVAREGSHVFYRL